MRRRINNRNTYLPNTYNYYKMLSEPMRTSLTAIPSAIQRRPWNRTLLSFLEPQTNEKKAWGCCKNFRTSENFQKQPSQ